MKRLFALSAASLLSLSAMNAQEAFKSLGLSFEFGTTGLGVNLSYPLVTDHLIFMAGYNFPSLPITTDMSFSPTALNQKVNEANTMINKYNSVVKQYSDKLAEYGQTSKYEQMDKLQSIGELTVDAKATMMFKSFKLLFEYYPTTQSRFHITAGVFFGGDEMIKIHGQLNDQAWGAYESAILASNNANALSAELKREHPDFDMSGITPVADIDKAARFNIDGETFYLNPAKKGAFDAVLKVQKVKPYIGIGFGGSIPRKRVGFQTELGFYYQGKVKVVSDDYYYADGATSPTYDSGAYTDKTVDNIMSTMKSFSIYPQLTFRFTGRLFGKSYHLEALH